MLLLAGLAVCQSAVLPLFNSIHDPWVSHGHHLSAVPVAAGVPIWTPGFHASQFHAQDELGQASFGYSHPGQASSTFRDAWGNQVGSYAYIDAEGKEVRVSFVADANGFRVVSNNLPVAPSAVHAVGPAPVQDTAEVAAAKAAHFAAVAEAKERNAGTHRRRRYAPLVNLQDNSLSHLPVSLSLDHAPTSHVFALPPTVSVTAVHDHAFPSVFNPVSVAVPHHTVPVLTEQPLAIASHVQPALVHEVAAVNLATPHAVVAVPSVTVTKFHAQDELGQASFGHTTPDQSHSAFRDALGNQVGHYAYLTPEGKEVRVHYTAGHGGFRVLSNALPQAPSAASVHSASDIIQEDPDVIAARKEHFAAFEEALNRMKQPATD